MGRFKIILIILVFQLIYGGLKAQEVHNSQYYETPLHLNPANAGDSYYNFRGGLNIRNQWSTVSVPFTAQYMYADVRIPTLAIKKCWLGLAASFLNDIAGDGIKSTYGGLTLAFHKIASRKNNLVLSGGATVQMINKSVNYQNIKFAEQWKDNSFAGSALPANLGGASSLFYMDFSVGTKLSYYYHSDRYSIGLSASHINQPSESFYQMTNNMATKLTLNLDIMKWVNKGRLIINPSLAMDMQDGKYYGIIGTNILKPYNLDRTKSVIFGVAYRTTEELIPSVGMEFQNYKLMTSYDIPITGKTYSNRGGFEFTFTYTIGYSDPIEQIVRYKSLKAKKLKDKALPCPKFFLKSGF